MPHEPTRWIAALTLTAAVTLTAASPADAQPCGMTVPARLTPSQSAAADTIRDVWPDNLEDRALRIAWRESRLDPKARHRNRNGTIDVGLFQVNSVNVAFARRVALANLFDARTNTRFALDLWRRSGWKPWRCR